MHNSRTRVLVLGASGMLGSTLFRAFSRDPELLTFGSVREASAKRHFVPELYDALIPNVHLDGESGLLTAFAVAKPDVVVNCIGIIKQLPNANDHLESLAINSTLPHRLAKYCDATGARLVHFSTDCVFSGKQGNYREEDFPDAYDLYGRSKFLGEVSYENSITLRTSIVGHELDRSKSLVDWFLSQSGEVKGFTKAVFSGLPTIEVARVVKEYVIPNPNLSGLFHLSVDPINKYELLNLVASTYGKSTNIIPNDKLVIDRSLNSDRFRTATGFKPKAWPELIKEMHQEYLLTH
ncbi:dTDP-4-dehydrorhamnose reductase family protein [Limnohabitans sp.]